MFGTEQVSRYAVITNPAGAEVYIDGDKAGDLTTSISSSKSGGHQRTITIKMAGHKTVEKQYIPDGSVIPISVTLEKDGQ